MVRRCLMVVFWGVLAAGTALAADEALLAKGVAEYQAENYEEALATLAQADPSGADGPVAFQRGLVLQQMGDSRGAAAAFQTAAQGGVTDPALFRALVEVRLSFDDLAGAEAALTSGEQAGLPAVEVAYLRGLIAARRQEYAAALRYFEEASQDPQLAAAARLQMAMIYAAQKNYTQARQSLQAITAISPQSAVAEYARDYERQFAAAMARHRTWFGRVQAGYLYDSNANAKPLAAISGLDIVDGQDSAFSGGLRLDYQPQLSGNRLFLAEYNLSSTLYKEIETSNQVVQNLTLTPGYNYGEGIVSLPLSYAYYRLDNASYMQTLGVKPTVSLRLGQEHVLQGSAGYTRRTMLIDYANATTEDTESRDADLLSVGANYLYLFAAGRGMLSARYEFSDDRTRGDNWVNQGNRFTVSGLLPLSQSVSLNLSGDVHLQQYDNTNTYFDLRRRDTTTSGTLGATWDLSRALKLYASATASRVDSNISIYTYRRNVFTTGLEFNF